MKDVYFKIIKNEKIARNTYLALLEGDTSGIRHGQFINLKLDGLYLRRPISVCDVTGSLLTIIYKVVGKGTEQMSRARAGECWLALTELGNGYDTTPSGENPLLIGGGVGAPPMYMLAKSLLKEGKRPRVLLGFGTGDEVFLENELRALGIEVTVTTVDGSYGRRGLVTDAMADLDYSYFYACGPEAMLRAVCDASQTSGQLSFEERMGCGFGACMGCTCETKYGAKRICRDGPVLVKEEIIW